MDWRVDTDQRFMVVFGNVLKSYICCSEAIGKAKGERVEICLLFKATYMKFAQNRKIVLNCIHIYCCFASALSCAKLLRHIRTFRTGAQKYTVLCRPSLKSNLFSSIHTWFTFVRAESQIKFYFFQCLVKE